MPNLPYHFSNTDTDIQRPAPDLGQHNEELALEMGFSSEEIRDMQRDDVLYQPS